MSIQYGAGNEHCRSTLNTVTILFLFMKIFVFSYMGWLMPVPDVTRQKGGVCYGHVA